jgi:hypothetical protein
MIPNPGGWWSDLERSHDEEFRAVAALAQHLLAVIQIPRPLHQNEDQPVGGVSDISNRGNPSRLLLSELANDDETLAIRLAYDEALYLRRESPPAMPLPERHILLDNGILLWGQARIYATSVALALLKPRTPGETVTLHGHLPPAFERMEIASAGDLRTWWARLELSPDCETALDHLLDILTEAPAQAQPEIVLITHEDAETALAPHLQGRAWPTGVRFFVFTVNGSGRCQLLQRSESGRREIVRFQLKPPPALQPAGER